MSRHTAFVKHTCNSQSILRRIADYIDSENGSCKVYLAPFAVFLNENDKNYVEPDISVICDTAKLDDKGCCGAPDWIIEVVSQGNRPMDYFTKLFKYKTAGVREYWIVDPMETTYYSLFFRKRKSRRIFFWRRCPGWNIQRIFNKNTVKKIRIFYTQKG